MCDGLAVDEPTTNPGPRGVVIAWACPELSSPLSGLDWTHGSNLTRYWLAGFRLNTSCEITGSL